MNAGALALGDGPGAPVLPFIARLWRADGTWETVPVGEVERGPAGDITARGASENFAAAVSFSAPVQDRGRRLARLSLRVTGVSPVQVGVRVECRLGPSDDPGWLVPGLFYGENRRPDSRRRYPRFTTEGPQAALLESDSWSFRADRAATPIVFAYAGGAGAALMTSETSALGESGLGFALEDGCPVLRLHFPFREEPVTYYGSEVPLPAEVRTAPFAPGATVDLEFAAYLLGPDRHGYAAVLRQVREQAGRPVRAAPSPSPGPALSPSPGKVAWVNVPQAASLTAEGLYRWHYRPHPAVLLETAAFDREALGERGDRAAMHVSWVSGAPYAYALLRHARRTGRRPYLEAATAVLAHICDNLTPGGTFWGQWQAASGWGTGWTAEPGRLHSRTLADATLFVLRALGCEQAHGATQPVWEQAVRSNLEVAMAAQRPDGALAAAHAADDGRPVDWRGSAGLAWVAPLAEAGMMFSRSDLLDAAARAGAYFEAFVEREYLCGAPEDVDLAPTSEDGYLAVMSYMALWRADGDKRWLVAARRAADWMLTFRYTYDVSFSPLTLLGHYRFHTRGADQASPSNQHLHAFGLICQPEMAQLSAALDDGYYRGQAQEALAWARQFIAREDGDFNAYRGMVSERFYQTDCFQAKGMLLTLSHAWSVGVVLLACEEAITSGEDWEET